MSVRTLRLCLSEGSLIAEVKIDVDRLPPLVSSRGGVLFRLIKSVDGDVAEYRETVPYTVPIGAFELASTGQPEWHLDHAASGRRSRARLGQWELLAYDDGRWEVRAPNINHGAEGEEANGEDAKMRALLVYAALQPFGGES